MSLNVVCDVPPDILSLGVKLDYIKWCLSHHIYKWLYFCLCFSIFLCWLMTYIYVSCDYEFAFDYINNTLFSLNGLIFYGGWVYIKFFNKNKTLKSLTTDQSVLYLRKGFLILKTLNNKSLLCLSSSRIFQFSSLAFFSFILHEETKIGQ